MDPRATIALGKIRTIMKRFDFRQSFTGRLSDATLLRQSPTVIAHTRDEDLMEALTDARWEPAAALKCGGTVSFLNESGGSAPGTQRPPGMRQAEEAPPSCVHLARHGPS